MLIESHTLFGLVSLVAGGLVLARRKGDRLHRLVGRVYAVAMALLCGGSYWIQDSTPFYEGLGPFHVAATVSLVTLLAGLAAALFRARIPNWVGWHYMMMGWSYIGLVMATGSHLIEPAAQALAGLGVPEGAASWGAVALCWGVPPLVGGRLLKAREGAYLARFGAAQAA